MSISKNISNTMASLLKLAYKWEDAKHPVPELGTRFYFDEIMFGITRKCNLKCAHCLLRLTHKGNLTYPELQEWEMADTVSIGNIMEETLESMLERNQWEELRCWESKILDGSDHGRGQIDPKIADIYTYMFKHIKDGRKLLHEEFPYIDYATICSLVDLSAYNFMGDTWLRLVGYDEEEIKKANEELSEEFIDHFFKICQENNYYLCMSGAPKARQLPYDKEQKHVNNCEL